MSDSGERGRRFDGSRPDGQRSGGQRPDGQRRGGSGGGRDGAGRDGAGARRPQGDRPASGRPSTGRPDAERGSKSERGGRPTRPGATDDKRLWTKGGAPARGDRTARDRELPEDRDPFNTRSVRAQFDAPEVPEDVKDSDLDRVARNELKTLEKENAEGVAKHLVMAARLIDDDPELAHRHAVAASRRAGRIGVVRETLAITAYATGDFALALRELRTFRRITGRNDHLPMMVDSERGVGRPDKALELGRSVPRSSLPVPVQVELAIAMSGARLDLEQPDAALIELQIPQLDPTTAYSFSPALFDAYATVLEELGRQAEAEEWFARADTAREALDEADGADDDTIEIVEIDDDVADVDEVDELEEAGREDDVEGGA